MIRICKFSRQYEGFCELKMNWCILVLMVFCLKLVSCQNDKDRESRDLAAWGGSWSIYPTMGSWSVQTRIPMTPEFADTSRDVGGKKGGKYRKKFKRFILPLLLAYKLKFFTLIPVLLGGLVLLTGATGLAGFFFALFAAVMGLKSSGSTHRAFRH
ncbi:unnamed protein product [Psylliodes chrysocephalus]|uniref:Uncharacterized protein n=1 Tax=Psylliodes chrysocephalus TaxID=3402493 RepID=A0A9P0GF32_9CUCU|nr:unnamed protein product [Psylliodes chrysocephala]